MKKSLLFVLVAVLLTAMAFSTASADRGGAPPDELCICEVSIDLNLDGICDVCGLHIPHGDCIPNGDCDPDCDGEPDQNRNRDGSCQD